MTLTLPPFRGVTRQIVLLAVVSYLGMLLLNLVLTRDFLTGFLVLVPVYILHGRVWQLLTYPFVGGGLLSVAFGALSVWFFGSTLEDERGRRWMGEYFLWTTVGGGVLTTLLAYAINDRISGINPATFTAGIWPFALSLVVAFAHFHPEEKLRIDFLFTLKAKYLAAIYVLVYVAMLLLGRDPFTMLMTLCNVAAAYGFLRLAPRRGVRNGASELIFSLRNAYQAAQRRKAAKKFVVYMRKQGKEVSLDAEGRYVDPDGKPRDINDRRWMN